MTPSTIRATLAPLVSVEAEIMRMCMVRWAVQIDQQGSTVKFNSDIPERRLTPMLAKASELLADAGFRVVSLSPACFKVFN